MKNIILISILTLLLVNCSKEDNTNEPELYESQSIIIRNAGLVLLHTQYNLLFERLELVNNEGFISENEQIKAAHCLQYLASGLTQNKDTLLSLNKLLCNIDAYQPIEGSVDISDSEKEIIDSFTVAIFTLFWPALGDVELASFRATFLMRDGILKEKEDRWVLTVPNGNADLLLHNLVLPFSVINHYGMQKPIYVNWEY